MNVNDTGGAMTTELYNDVFDDLINRNSPEAKAMRRAAMAYTRVREIVGHMEYIEGDPRTVLAKEKLSNAERTLYVAGLTLALKVVGR
jgi:hypothetical protein